MGVGVITGTRNRRPSGALPPCLSHFFYTYPYCLPASLLHCFCAAGQLLVLPPCFISFPCSAIQGSYQSGKKSGDGVYQFLNSDVYEGEFASDRMDGHGVYTFMHEGRWEGGPRASSATHDVRLPSHSSFFLTSLVIALIQNSRGT